MLSWLDPGMTSYLEKPIFKCVCQCSWRKRLAFKLAGYTKPVTLSDMCRQYQSPKGLNRMKRWRRHYFSLSGWAAASIFFFLQVLTFVVVKCLDPACTCTIGFSGLLALGLQGSCIGCINCLLCSSDHNTWQKQLNIGKIPLDSQFQGAFSSLQCGCYDGMVQGMSIMEFVVRCSHHTSLGNREKW